MISFFLLQVPVQKENILRGFSYKTPQEAHSIVIFIMTRCLQIKSIVNLFSHTEDCS